MRRAIFKLMVSINKLAILLLLLSQAAGEISPEKIWGLAFFGIAYPFFLAANVVLLLLWVVKRKTIALLPFVFIMLNMDRVQSYIPLNWSAPIGPSTAETKVNFKFMSYNVRIFNQFNWTGDKSSGSKAINHIVKEKPDVIFIQEFTNRKINGQTPTEHFENEAQLIHHVTEAKPGNKRYNDLAIFSKYEILNSEFLNAEDQQFALQADLLVGQDTIRFINVHLQSLRFKKAEYDFIDSLGRQTKKTTHDNMRKVASKLKNAFQRRAIQADTIAIRVQNSPYPVVLAGDFNDTPSSYTYHKIRGKLQDAFVENGFGMGATYTRVHFPFRIDYMMHDTNFRSFNFRNSTVDYSDHRPISTCLTLLRK